jgi:hypothetical protein
MTTTPSWRQLAAIPSSKTRHIFACGGGVQSTACLVLAGHGIIPYRTFVFANVGDKAESPDTIAYIRDVLAPYAAKAGIEWVEVQRRRRDGTPVDLYDELHRPIRSIDIPVRTSPAGSPGNRNCTVTFKIKPIAKWIKAHAPGCTLGKGISVDESHRATPARDSDLYSVAYPLIELGLSRSDCLRIAQDAGIPRPPKSSCWFCPYKTRHQWGEMRRDNPSLFAKSVELESMINQKRISMGKDKVWLSGKGANLGLPLDRVVPVQLDLLASMEWLDEQDGCESGYCMT